jgi:alpha-amylase/alpha-mannosidase (GH57 family)
LDRFRRKKKEEVKKEEVKEEVKTELEILCTDDREVYEALFNTMFLNPTKITVSMEEAAKRAKEFKEIGDKVRAITEFKIAGGLAIWKGNVQKVKEFFSECKELSGKDYPILKNPERAVRKAQEYYKKHLKEEEK